MLAAGALAEGSDRRNRLVSGLRAGRRLRGSGAAAGAEGTTLAWRHRPGHADDALIARPLLIDPVEALSVPQNGPAKGPLTPNLPRFIG